MRILKLFVLMVVLAAVVVPAEAVTIPPLPNGALYLKSRNQDNGTTYIDTGLAPGNSVSLVPADFNTAQRIAFKAPGSINNEDTWGIALLYQIAPGTISNPGSNGTQVDYTGPITYDNSAGTQSTWLVAMFYGGVDTNVVLEAGNGTGVGQNGIPVGDFSESITSVGVNFKLFAVDKANLAAGADSVGLLPYSAAGHTADDTYVGWTDATALAGSTLLLEGTSDYFLSTVVVDGSGSIVGNDNASTAYFDIPENGAGLWNKALGTTDQLLTPEGVPTNLFFQWTLSNSTQGWTVKSDDIGGAVAVIPEPVTMFGLFLGIGGVGGYLRRRNRA